MIQKLTTLLFILCLTLSVQAQKKPGFSKEEFRAKQEAYLTQKAELTAEEAGKFFPIYFETGKVTNANIQAYGGSERVSYGLGLGYYNESGVFKGTGFKRF